MQSPPPGFFARLAMALRILFDGLLAHRVQAALAAPAAGGLAAPAAPAALPPPEAPSSAPASAPPPQGRDPAPALQLLALLQREGRLIDFLREDVASFSDAEVGAAARVVHEGCQKVLGQYFELAPVRLEDEGTALVLAPGFDARRHRLTGNVTGEPPFRGRLAHPGWLVNHVQLPELGPDHDPAVIAPAEVEL